MIKQELKFLYDKGKEYEEQIQTIREQMKPFQNKGFDGKLVDDEGFPKPELDFGELTHYKNLKRQLSEINNDHKTLMDKIQSLMIQYHNELKNDPNVIAEMEKYDLERQQQKEKSIQTKIQTPQNQEIISNSTEIQKANLPQVYQPFAQITEVSQNSPAFISNLQVDDLIVQFGSVDKVNHNGLLGLAQCVQSNINKNLKLLVLRLVKEGTLENTLLYNELNLTPQSWSGPGVLGYIFIFQKLTNQQMQIQVSKLREKQLEKFFCVKVDINIFQHQGQQLYFKYL